ncbi:hypothetical protein NQ315_017151, partial [Exocentrus adspersus]
MARKKIEEHHLSPEKKTKSEKRKLSRNQPSTSAIESENLPPSAKQQKLEEPGEMESQPSTSAIESEVSASLDKQPESQKPGQVESQPRALEQSGTLVSDAGPSISGVDPSKPSVAMYEAELYLAQLEIERKENLIKSLRICMRYEHIYDSDKLILEYTGLPTRMIFESLYELIEEVENNYYSNWQVHKLRKIDQLLMTVMKLRQNFTHSDLAYRFQVSEATVTNVVVTFIHVLHEVLFKVLMKDIPSRSKNKTCLPNCASTFTNCRIILDATEVFCAVPRKSMKNQ